MPPAPQQQAGSGSGAASAQKAGKKKARVESGACPPLRPLAERGGEEEEEDVEVLELGRLRLHIGAPLPRPLRRGFAGWLIERRECAYGVEAEAQIGVLQRLFRQALAVREYKRWCVGLRAGAAAAAEAAEGGGEGWVDLRVAGGSLGDKAAVQAVVMEANLREVIRDEGTQEEKVAMVLLTRWLASAERGEGGSDDGSGGGYGGESDDDEEDSDFGGGGSAKRKRPRPSVGSASSSKVSPISSSALVGSRRIGLTDEMKNRFIDWLLVTKSMNKVRWGFSLF